jgi:hypothetical protein
MKEIKMAAGNFSAENGFPDPPPSEKNIPISVPVL